MFVLAATLASIAAPVTENVLSTTDLHAVIGSHAKLHLINLATQRQAFHDSSVRSEILKQNPNRKMIGTFITSCEDDVAYENGNPNRPVPISSIAAERITGTQVVTDLTIYVRDALCRPNASDVLAKIVLYSEIEYLGMSNLPENRGGKRIKYVPTNGEYTFNYQGPYGEIIQELNSFCPCHNTHKPDPGIWRTDQQRNLTVADCANGPNDPNSGRPGPSDLCNLVKGLPLFQTYKWIDYNHYIQSEGAFDGNIGWNLPINRTLVNTLLDSSGDVNPGSCGYQVWPDCKPGVERSAAVCDTCWGLECEACIYNEFPSQQGRTYEWNNCCPCLYYYADRHQLPWMKVNC